MALMRIEYTKTLSYGFSPFRYHPENHKLEDLNGIRNRHKNTIYLRNFEFNNKLTFKMSKNLDSKSNKENLFLIKIL